MTKKLLVNFFLVVCVSLVLSGIFYRQLNRIVPPSLNPLEETVSFLNTDTAYYDAIFIGSSRVFVHINPAIIDSVCHLNSRCLAIDGSTISEQYIMLIKYMQHHKAPKIIFLGLDYASLEGYHLPYDYPYYYAYVNDPVFDSIMGRVNRHFRYKGFYKFYDTFVRNSARTDYQKYAVLSSLARPSKKFNDLSDDPSWQAGLKKYKGYCGLDRKWQKEADKDLDVTGKAEIDELGTVLFDEFLKDSKEYCPNTIILYSPIYGGFGKNFDAKLFFGQVDKMAKKHSLPFWNYMGGSEWANKGYFYNWEHLNVEGSTHFSFELASDINKFMNNLQVDTLNGSR